MERLKSLRKIKNISQKEFAQHMNVAQNTVSRWESGDRLMDTETLLRAANFFNVSTDYLLNRNENNIMKNVKDSQAEKLLKDFFSLNDFGKVEAMKRVSELSELPKYRKGYSNDTPIAAHNDAVIDEEELKLMQEDIDDLGRLR